jgi:LmbE family N-acetylglucosaminyl deacetylase
VVSAHFDDAALSVAHLLQAAAGRATVLTVCGGVPPPDGYLGGWDLEAGFASGTEAARSRALEDRRSCAVTGARRARLRHLDGPYRSGGMRCGAIRRAVERRLGDDDVLWLPAGIGAHADHVDVRSALLPLAATLPASRVHVYADLPYAGHYGHDLPPEVGAALPGLRPRDIHRRGERLERKLEAVRCHASRITSLARSFPGLLDRDGVLSRERFWTV